MRRRLHRSSRRHHRHRLVVDPVDPGDRGRRPSISPCSSARRNYSIPARNHDLTPDYQKSWKDNYPELRRQAREGNPQRRRRPDARQGRAGRDTPGGAAARFMTRMAGGRPALSWPSYNNLALDKASTTTAGRLRAREDRPGRQDIASGKTPAAATYPIGTKRNLPRYRLFRDLQPRQDSLWSTSANAPIDANHAEGFDHGRQGVRVRRHRVCDRVRCDDRLVRKSRLRGRSGLTAEGQMGGRPEDLSRPDGHRLPEHGSSSPVPAARRCCRT